MKPRSVAMLLALILLAGVFGASQGLAHMRASYNGVCGELSGLPGLLQKMNFFDSGTCGNTCSGTCTVKTKSGIVTGNCQHAKKNGDCICLVP